MSREPRIIRKQTGNFLEDFQPGQVFRHKGGKTITEGLFSTFTEFSMTSNPLAKNAHYARAYLALALNLTNAQKYDNDIATFARQSQIYHRR